MKLYAEVDDKDRKLKTLYGIVEYMDGTRLVCDKFYAVKEQEQKPKTIQEIQAESEKYQKAFEDGYEQGYAQARFDYEQEPCEDAISRQYLIEKATNWEKHFHDSERYVSLTDIQNAPPVKLQEQKTDSWSIKDVADTLAKHGLIKEQNPKTGHWIKLFLIDTSDIDGQCSECGFIHRFIDGHTTQYDYCPNCGAKMESEVEE